MSKKKIDPIVILQKGDKIKLANGELMTIKLDNFRLRQSQFTMVEDMADVRVKSILSSPNPKKEFFNQINNILKF